MKKEEATTKKTEAKEEATTEKKHIQVVYSNKRKKTIIYVLFAAAIFLLIICFVFVAIHTRVPRFRLDNLYVSPLSLNSSVMVQLSSTNPSPKCSVYYTNMNIYVKVLGDFETESVLLENKLQKPHEVATWTAVVATNNEKVRPSGTFLVRNGLADGDVIADLMIQWKWWIFSSTKYSYQVRCPVLLRLEDLSSAIAEPMSTCSRRRHST